MAKKFSFNPAKIGFTKCSDDGDVYEFKKENKLIAYFSYYSSGNPPYWILYEVTHHPEGSFTPTTNTLVYQGDIPSKAFAQELIKNTICLKEKKK